MAAGEHVWRHHRCHWEKNQGEGSFLVCHEKATEQFLFVSGSGAYAISKPLCARHCAETQPPETVEVFCVELR